MRTVCERDMCTACGACENICPTKCIHKCINHDDSWYMGIDADKCINCHLCEKVCPSVTNIELHEAKKTYAAWAKADEVHQNAASGGIVSILYEYALSKGMYIAGVSLDDKFEAHYNISTDSKDINEFRNSKYTYSFMDDVYKKIWDCLDYGKDILFVGLPCQVAAVKNYMRLKSHKGKLYTVDLVCHGTPPPTYLCQHINYISEKRKHEASKCFFRDAKYDTSNFAYTIYMYNSNKPFYKKYVEEDDLYQIGYHKALIYRDVCYRCAYAKRKRAGDITLGDYVGLGKLAPYNGKRHKVSCLVINTNQGKELIEEVNKRDLLCMYERPLIEPMLGIAQFNYPFKKVPECEAFKSIYEKDRNFENAAGKAFRKYVLKNRVKMFFHYREIKKIISRILPEIIKNKIRKLF